MKRYIIGITGASGSIYACRLIEELIGKHDCELHLIFTNCGKKVFQYEMDMDWNTWISVFDENKIIVHDFDNLFAPVASGSFQVEGMVIVPCSMATLGRLSMGIGDNLLLRAGDVMIKEKRKLILVPRETPLSTIHLRNMLTLSEMGVHLIPPMPAFYQKPKTIDEIVNGTVGRILEHLGLENGLYKKWGEK